MPINTEKFQITIFLDELEERNIGNMSLGNHYHHSNIKKLVEFDSEEQREEFLKQFELHEAYNDLDSSLSRTFLKLPNRSFINYMHVTKVEKGNV